MHVVVDSSVLVSSLIDIQGPIGVAYRSKLVELIGADQGYIIRTLTKLEVVSALRKLLLRAERSETGVVAATADDCARVVKGMSAWPFTRIELTQPMLNRVWELRGNMTPYDAMYVAATEQLMADRRGDVIFATADARLAKAPILSVPVELFTP